MKQEKKEEDVGVVGKRRMSGTFHTRWHSSISILEFGIWIQNGMKPKTFLKNWISNVHVCMFLLSNMILQRFRRYKGGHRSNIEVENFNCPLRLEFSGSQLSVLQIWFHASMHILLYENSLQIYRSNIFPRDFEKKKRKQQPWIAKIMPLMGILKNTPTIWYLACFVEWIHHRFSALISIQISFSHTFFNP